MRAIIAHPGSCLASQSLAHMKVPHLHCVPLSLFPEGPSGRLHIQNDRPQLTPGFLVSIVLQGSSCSHLGATGLAKSLPQDFLVSKVAASSSKGLSDLAGEGSSTASDVAVSGLSSFSGDEGTDFVVSSFLGGLMKKPFRLCCPLAGPLLSDLDFFEGGAPFVEEKLRLRPLDLNDDVADCGDCDGVGSL